MKRFFRVYSVSLRPRESKWYSTIDSVEHRSWWSTALSMAQSGSSWTKARDWECMKAHHGAMVQILNEQMVLRHRLTLVTRTRSRKQRALSRPGPCNEPSSTLPSSSQVLSRYLDWLVSPRPSSFETMCLTKLSQPLCTSNMGMTKPGAAKHPLTHLAPALGWT